MPGLDSPRQWWASFGIGGRALAGLERQGLCDKAVLRRRGESLVLDAAGADALGVAGLTPSQIHVFRRALSLGLRMDPANDEPGLYECVTCVWSPSLRPKISIRTYASLAAIATVLVGFGNGVGVEGGETEAEERSQWLLLLLRLLLAPRALLLLL
jgi:hypothetical protein